MLGQSAKGFALAKISGYEEMHISNDDDLYIVQITSKLWNTYHAKEHVRLACEKSLADLNLTYLDLYLIHFPISQRFVPIETRYPPEWIYDPNAPNPKIELQPVPLRETWQAMEELVTGSLVRNIGVCNLVVHYYGICSACHFDCV